MWRANTRYNNELNLLVELLEEKGILEKGDFEKATDPTGYLFRQHYEEITRILEDRNEGASFESWSQNITIYYSKYITEDEKEQIRSLFGDRRHSVSFDRCVILCNLCMSWGSGSRARGRSLIENRGEECERCGSTIYDKKEESIVTLIKPSKWRRLLRRKWKKAD